MLVIARHDIQDPQAFWTTAQNVGSIMPADLKLHSVFPSKDMKDGICVWEGPSVEAVQKFLDDNVGTVSKNFCYEVDAATAMGAPAMAMGAAAN
jgi:hypothetical protein